MDPDNTASLFDAIKAGDLALVSELLDGEPTLVDACTATGESAIVLAVYYERTEIVDLLLEHDAALDLFAASAVGDLESVRLLLTAQPESINDFAPDGFTALGLAAFFGHDLLVAELLALGADVNQASNNSQHVMPLHSAVAHQHLAIAEMLLQHGAQVNAVQSDEFTPLLAAAQNGQLAMVQLLLRHGADATMRKDGGQTALDLAREFGHPNVVIMLERHQQQRPLA